MPFGHKAGLPPSKKYLLMRQPHVVLCREAEQMNGSVDSWRSLCCSFFDQLDRLIRAQNSTVNDVHDP